MKRFGGRRVRSGSEDSPSARVKVGAHPAHRGGSVAHPDHRRLARRDLDACLGRPPSGHRVSLARQCCNLLSRCIHFVEPISMNFAGRRSRDVPAKPVRIVHPKRGQPPGSGDAQPIHTNRRRPCLYQRSTGCNPPPQCCCRDRHGCEIPRQHGHRPPCAPRAMRPGKSMDVAMVFTAQQRATTAKHPPAHRQQGDGRNDPKPPDRDPESSAKNPAQNTRFHIVSSEKKNPHARQHQPAQNSKTPSSSMP